MTPTDTPTSKCCGKCSGEFKDECYCPYEICCATPTTDSKNSVGASAAIKETDYKVHNAEILGNGARPSKNSSEDWEKRVEKDIRAIFAERHVDHEWRVENLASLVWLECQKIAKEEYERGRRDTVEFIREHSDYPPDEKWRVEDSALEAALKTP